MLIAFTHAFKSFLPEIEAYRQFFEQYGIATTEVRPDQVDSLKPEVEWRFMGLHLSRSKAPALIHEYASASLPPWRNTKDFIKSRFNIIPGFRLFLNQYVQDRLPFRDDVPYGFRDMGIYPLANTMGEEKKIYDFIYVGSVSRDIRPEKLLDCFKQYSLEHKTLLMLCKDYETLQEKFRPFSNIIFKGPVPQKEVSDYIKQSRFAINYKPDIAPHNEQTSTKFLEYAACGTPVITTDFIWMRKFQQQYGGKYFFLEKDLANFDWEKVNQFQYSYPDLKDWTWEKQIRGSGVLQFLQGKFGDLGFFSRAGRG
jgi:glycosyltransferase involved in cell wall biosynthesis